MASLCDKGQHPCSRLNRYNLYSFARNASGFGPEDDVFIIWPSATRCVIRNWDEDEIKTELAYTTEEACLIGAMQGLLMAVLISGAMLGMA